MVNELIGQSNLNRPGLIGRLMSSTTHSPRVSVCLRDMEWQRGEISNVILDFGQGWLWNVRK